jgi:thiol-disulfide isomerase/thioredoxin
MFKKITCTLLLILSLSFVFASALSQSIEKAIQSSADEASALELIRKYVAQTDDLEDLRLLQNYWLMLDKDECKRYFTVLKEKNPKSEKYIYLWARTLDDVQAQKQTGRNLIKKHPSFEYGYRLLLTHYQKELFITPSPEHPSAQSMMKDYKKDRKYFDRYLKKFPSSETSIFLTLGALVWEKKVEEANRLLAKALTLEASWLNWQFYTDYYLKTNQLLMLETYIRHLVDTSDYTKNMSAEEKDYQIDFIYLSTLMSGDAYTAIFDYVKAHPMSLADPRVQKVFLIACASYGDFDMAFLLLNKMGTQSGVLYQWLLTDEDIAPLRKDVRWQAMIDSAKTAWDAGKDERKAEVAGTKMSKPAPAWELVDLQGKTVKLADLKGSIVILDFWATWCEPCRKAMPVLDNWMKTKMPSGVKVYSINVWERNADVVAPFWNERNYAMTMLYGTNNLSQDYGFDGIPYICIIDKNGNIRYEEKGFSEELAEILTFWVEDLQ